MAAVRTDLEVGGTGGSRETGWEALQKSRQDRMDAWARVIVQDVGRMAGG